MKAGAIAALLVATAAVRSFDVQATESAQAPTPDQVLRSFQAEDYRLAYDVMIGARRLEDAWLIAERAVRELPRDRDWRRRLARVAEWTGRLALAAKQWQVLFRLGDRSDDTIVGLQRLAPVADDPDTVLQAWMYSAAHKPLSEAQWAEVYWLFENAADPVRGSRFFEDQYRIRKLPRLLDLAARLAANAGDDDRALALYSERAALEPFSLEAVLQTAFGHIRRDQWPQARAVLQAHASRVPEDAAEFWRLLGQVAWETRDFAGARQAYDRAAHSPRGEAGDWARLVFLARQEDARAATTLALEAYRRFGAVEQLQQALSLYAELGDTAGQRRIYRSLSAEQLARAEQSAQFLLGRAQYFQRNNQSDAAWQDLLRARRLAPQDSSVVQSLLWFLINEGRRPELARAVREYRSLAAGDPDYWLIFAAADQTLGRHEEALAWYQRKLQQQSDDPLVLLNYADELTTLGRTGMADRVRREAWRLLQRQRPTKPMDLRRLGQQASLQAWVRLALRDRPGDPGHQLARELAWQLRSESVDPAAQEEIDNLLLGWALLKEQLPLARDWMLARYVRQSRDAPAWAEAQVALQRGDAERMDALLGARGRSLPAVTRHDLALALGRTPQALQLAQGGASDGEAADAMYERLRTEAPRQVNYLQGRVFDETLDTYQRRGAQFEARWVARPTVQVLAGVTRVQQSSGDADFATLLPGADHLDYAGLRLIGPSREHHLTLTQRDALAHVTGLRLRRLANPNARLSYEAGFDLHQESLLSLPLRVAGYEDGLYASISYNLDQRNYLRVAPRWARYATQYSDALGSGRILELEAGHRLRAGESSWRVRVYAVGQDFNRDGSISAASLASLPAYLQSGIASGSIDAAAYFIPQSNTTVGVCVAAGETAAGVGQNAAYRRAWQPFMDLCLRHNTLAGDGYAGLVGVAGPLAGGDELAVQWQGSDVSVPGSAATHALSIRYRHYF